MENQQKVRRYFQSIESRLGYNLVLWGSKHFGFYPSETNDIPEKEAQELMQDLVAERLSLKASDEVLDAGCGQGIVSSYIAGKYHCKVSGITIVPFEVGKANALAKKRGLQTKLSYQEMDYCDMSFANDTFDAVYTTEAFVHSPDVERTLKEFFRVLKPGGRLALFEYTMAEDDQFTDTEIEILNRIIDGSAMPGLREMRHDKFSEVIGCAGFKNAKEQNITLNVGPSWYRLHKFAKRFYGLIKLLRLQRILFNTTLAVELYPITDKGLVRYCIFTAVKPANNT